MIQLRLKVLLEPIGVPVDYIEPEKEMSDFFIVAFDNEQMIGCCVLSPKNGNMIQLRQMAVLPAWQGKGVGAAIIQFAEKTAKQNGYQTIMMHARNPVIAFYKKNGYTVAGKEFFEVGIGHHKMSKRLTEPFK